jgi:hypothetical protein
MTLLPGDVISAEPLSRWVELTTQIFKHLGDVVGVGIVDGLGSSRQTAKAYSKFYTI